MENIIPTFYFPFGECMITLEDVALQLDLSIDGEPGMGVTSGDLVSLCEELLGFLPPAEVIKENTIKLSLLNNAFRKLLDNETEVVMSQRAR